VRSYYKQFRDLFVDTSNETLLSKEDERLVSALFKLLIMALGALVLVFAIDVYYSKSINVLGQFGDFFGGVLNPIFTFLTFFGLVVTIVIQRIELRLARDEFAKTSSALNTQAIETTFFNTLDLHHKIVDGLQVDIELLLRPNFGELGEPLSEKTLYEGREVFSAIVHELSAFSESPDDVIKYYSYIQEQHNYILGHYFRNLYQALKILDIYPDNTLERSAKRKYSRILRAQLSANELALLFVNCIDKMVDGGEFMNLLIRYQMLEHLPLEWDKEEGIYRVKGSGLPIGGSDIRQRYGEERELGQRPTIIGNRGAFGDNPAFYAYSTQTGQPFHRKLDTCSAANWTAVRGQTGPSERSAARG